MHKKIVIILFGIILLGSFLRFYHLGRTPISPDWDEASLGYNAYSILKTGRDEFGQFLPVVIRSFGDYKPALYVYLAIPSIEVFGLNTFAVVLPSAIFGVLTLFATYFLVKEIFIAHETKQKTIPLIVAFLLAISPWHLQFSRVAFEANVGLSLNIFGILFFLKGLKKPYYLVFSSISFALSLYAYQSEKAFVPFMIFLLGALFIKELQKTSKKFIISAFVLGFIISLPMIFFTLTNSQALARAQGVSIFANTNDLLQSTPNRISTDHANDDFLGLLFDNRRITYSKIIIGNYLSHFDPNFLFLKGDLPSRHQAPQMGHLYLFELPLLIIGVFTLIFGRFNKKIRLLLFFWIFIVPIPASVTFDVPNSVRTLNFLPTFQILTALGIITSFVFVSNIKYKILNIKLKHLFIVGFLLFAGFNFIYFFDQYFVQQDFFNASSWQYGYKDAIKATTKLGNKYSSIIVSNKWPMDQSYIFFLYYLQYNPKTYQDNLREDHAFGKYVFKDISEEIKKDNNVLYVGSVPDFPRNVKTLKTIYNPDNTPAIEIVEGKAL